VAAPRAQLAGQQPPAGPAALASEAAGVAAGGVGAAGVWNRLRHIRNRKKLLLGKKREGERQQEDDGAA
jgi:hypothetical protein